MTTQRTPSFWKTALGILPAMLVTLACSSLPSSGKKLSVTSDRRMSQLSFGERDVLLPNVSCRELDGAFFVLKEKTPTGEMQKRGTVSLRGNHYYLAVGAGMESGRYRCVVPTSTRVSQRSSDGTAWRADDFQAGL